MLWVAGIGQGHPDTHGEFSQVIAAPQAVDPTSWLDTVSTERIKLGGGDTVDLLQRKLDLALADHGPGDPADN